MKISEQIPQSSWDMIPSHMHGSVVRYLDDGIEPGGFLYAVLTNDLFGAVGKADYINKEHLKEWCSFVWMDMPSISWGDQETVEEWMKKVRIERKNS